MFFTIIFCFGILLKIYLQFQQPLEKIILCHWNHSHSGFIWHVVTCPHLTLANWGI